MTSYSKLLFIFILQSALALSVSSINISEVDVDGHFEQFASVNNSHHDNIDDSIVPHKHTHKHTEDGEEHEHTHEHFKVSNVEILKFQNKSGPDICLNYSYRRKQVFLNTAHISSEHSLEIFRPPIV
ncbi:hypothetical protein [Halobacteriovorax sp.]|uniref:hypothetical protein n=1 Tax=Halobacteriovorax sp. TaxID=2020862 RepID=UPI00356849EE